MRALVNLCIILVRLGRLRWAMVSKWNVGVLWGSAYERTLVVVEIGLVTWIALHQNVVECRGVLLNDPCQIIGAVENLQLCGFHHQRV